MATIWSVSPGSGTSDAEVIVTARSDESLRAVVHRMAETGRTRIPVVDPANASRLVGLVSLKDLSKARVRHLEEERRRDACCPSGASSRSLAS